jgi:3-oxoacyl-[acyl-carrier-protein] synthase II
MFGVGDPDILEFSLGHPALPAIPEQRCGDGQDVVVTGLGMTMPLGGDVDSAWAALLSGASGVSMLCEPWAHDLPVRLGARLTRDPLDVLDGAESCGLDRCQQAALAAAHQAWSDAGSPEVAAHRVAVVFGSGSGYPFRTGHRSGRPGCAGPGAAMRLAMGARAAAPDTHVCGASAIASGLSLLRTGKADVVLAGGAEACVTRSSISAFARMGALSRRHDDPCAACRPFDLARDGFVLAEGAGALVLERAGFARARGAKAHATLAGAGISADLPGPHGQAVAMREALRSAGLGPDDIAHVNAHAMGTPAGDRTEAAAVLTAIGPHPLVTAPKSATGHLLGGAGAVEAIFTLLSVRDDVVPPTRNLDDQDPDVTLEIVTGPPRPARVDAALSNSFGFGDNDVTLAFTKA